MKRDADEASARGYQLRLMAGPNRVNTAATRQRLKDVQDAIRIEGHPLRTTE